MGYINGARRYAMQELKLKIDGELMDMELLKNGTMKISDKSIICDGCRKRYTINFKKPKKACVSTIKTRCTYCGKENLSVIHLKK